MNYLFIEFEDLRSEQSMQFINAENERTASYLTNLPVFKELEQKALDVFSDETTLPALRYEEGYFYRTKRNKENPRGLFQRISRNDYLSQAEKWATLIDIDKLSTKDNKSYKLNFFAVCEDRILLHFSDGGTDATSIHEFDLNTVQLVDDGFNFPASRGRATFVSRNSILISTRFDDDSFTASGGPKKLKLLTRGQTLDEAKLLFETKHEDMGVYFVYQEHTKRKAYIIQHIKTWSTKTTYIFDNGQMIELKTPDNVDVFGIYKDKLICQNEEALPGIMPGSLLSIDPQDAVAGNLNFTVLVESKGTYQVAARRTGITENYIWFQVQENFVPQTKRLQFKDSKWILESIATQPNLSSTIELVMPDTEYAILRVEGFLTPPHYVLAKSANDVSVFIKTKQKDYSKEFTVERRFTSSLDGTQIHYFMVKPIKHQNKALPTLLTAYGGFGIPQFPTFRGLTAALWLEQGAQFALANIRGGGELGPDWHFAAKKEKRHKSYEDFIAVAEDMVHRQETTPKQLGIWGGSNGGLLVANVTNMRPDLFGAVMCLNALLDMKRFHLLFVGRNWMDEYGNPDDPQDIVYLEKISPFHNVDANKKYPSVFFETAITDDRVHPAHTRRLAALYKKLNLPYWFYENLEGGHEGNASIHNNAYMSALRFSFLIDATS